MENHDSETPKQETNLHTEIAQDVGAGVVAGASALGAYWLVRQVFNHLLRALTR